jgi:hypothetical protein
MMRIVVTSLLVALLAGATGYLYGRHAAATSPLAALAADGPTIARYRDGAVPRAEVEAEIAKQPDVLRAALRAPGARKTFTESIVRSEVFAHEAERQGLQKDPEFVRRYREVLGRFYVERTLPPLGREPPRGQLSMGLRSRCRRVKFSDLRGVAVSSRPHGARRRRIELPARTPPIEAPIQMGLT